MSGTSDDIESQLDSLLEDSADMQDPSALLTEPAPQEAPTGANIDQQLDGLTRQIDELIDEMGDARADQTPADGNDPADIAELDTVLAESADESGDDPMGDFETYDGRQAGSSHPTGTPRHAEAPTVPRVIGSSPLPVEPDGFDLDSGSLNSVDEVVNDDADDYPAAANAELGEVDRALDEALAETAPPTPHMTGSAAAVADELDADAAQQRPILRLHAAPPDDEPVDVVKPRVRRSLFAAMGWSLLHTANWPMRFVPDACRDAIGYCALMTLAVAAGLLTYAAAGLGASIGIAFLSLGAVWGYIIYDLFLRVRSAPIDAAPPAAPTDPPAPAAS